MEKVEQRNQIDYYEGMIIGKRGNAKKKNNAESGRIQSIQFFF